MIFAVWVCIKNPMSNVTRFTSCGVFSTYHFYSIAYAKAYNRDELLYMFWPYICIGYAKIEKAGLHVDRGCLV